MTDFRFNFECKDEETTSNTPSHELGSELNWILCEEVLLSVDSCKVEDYTDLKAIAVDNDHYVLKNLPETVTKSVLKHDITTYTDVVPAVYEGGFQVWECAHYTMTYFNKVKFDFTDRVVLDLGCGSGILGIYAASKQALAVHFQDYNKEVLEQFTLPNIVLNNVKTPVKFYAGDWASFGNYDLSEDGIYDIIVSSETIYNPSNYKKICEVIKKKMKKTGYAFISGKMHYFGVGGNMREFEEVLQWYGIFDVDTVSETSTGLNRKIIKVSFKSGG